MRILAGRRARGARRLLPLAGLLALAIAVRARADAWQLADFTSPAGKPAHGLVTESTGEPHARLVIGCESSADDGWRGIAVWRDGTVDGSPTAAQVAVSFFGRAPVTEKWQLRATDDGRVVVWPESSESLRRNLLREDSTRGQAAVTIEVRETGRAPAKLVFALEGLAQRSTELAAACGGWGPAGSAKRRERNW